MPWEGAVKEESFPHTASPLTGGEICQDRGEGRAERDLHRGSVPTGSPQSETPVHWGWWGLGAEARALEVRP